VLCELDDVPPPLSTRLAKAGNPKTLLLLQFTADDGDHVLELRRLLAVAADTYNSLVEQVHGRFAAAFPPSFCTRLCLAVHASAQQRQGLRFYTRVFTAVIASASFKAGSLESRCRQPIGTSNKKSLIRCFLMCRRRRRGSRCRRTRRRTCRRRTYA